MPVHEFGIYSFTEKSHKFRPVVISKSPSPPPPMQRQIHSEISKQIRPQASKVREAPSKASENEQDSWNDKMNVGQNLLQRGNTTELNQLRRGSGESRTLRPSSRCNTPRSQGRSNINSNDNVKNIGYIHNSAFRTNQTTPIAKTLSDAKNVLMKSTISNKEMEKHLCSSITINPQYTFQVSNNFSDRITSTNITKTIPSAFSSGPRDTLQPQQRRRLGRSPSPPPIRTTEQSRATNTPSPGEMIHARDSKSTLRAALSRLQLSGHRDGSIGAASLGARRDAPPDRRAPSVRSDERPLATQGDMLNSIKFQRRLREILTIERHGKNVDKSSINSKEKSTIRNVNSRTSTGTKPGMNRDIREKPSTIPSRGFNRPRPSSPKGRRYPQPSFY